MIDFKRLKKDFKINKYGGCTKYASIRAHLRGKLHMRKVHGETIFWVTGKSCWDYFGYDNKECIADERRHMFHWTMEDQAKLVESTIEKYRIKEADISSAA